MARTKSITKYDDERVELAVQDLKEAVLAAKIQEWALIGGQGLRAHGLGNMTKDIDFLFRNADFQNIAELLVAEHNWVPITYDEDHNEVEDTEVTVHFMDDPVLFDSGAERKIITLKTPEGLIADFLPAQHAVERRMLTEAMRTPFLHENVMLAPLGGIMLVKAKADRPKDRLALEQAAQYLPKPQLDDAVEWARKRDRATAEDLESMIQEARLRKPNRKSRKART